MATQPRELLSIPRAAQTFKLLGDEPRLRILLLLADREEMGVMELGQAIGMSQPAVSHHLTLLRLGGLIGFRRQGKSKFYSLTSELARRLLRGVEA